ncbi:phosphoribosylformylglycinamidine cyclo-ligase [Verrucomicrobiales bacterium]|nr:phosphoribosylformylglycinamidine cyclo-ligase [Verrucomicrobiales bacterium]|tara:strand:- start:552 stop:1544 length:993 start_codon:yes stop_codon:yes gene_type:complete
MSDEFTYKAAGVDIDEAAALVGDIGELRRRTEANRSLMQSFGLFAASYDLSDYKQPVIVTGCDGVGTKIELLLEHDQLEIAGKDLVAMNVNDILTTGGDPLLFLDYIGVGAIDKTKIKRLIAGMAEHLTSCDCILAGGETAEMPGIVPDGVVELSGFCVGAAEKPDLIDPSTIEVGDKLIGYPSDGFHANGWSLIRKILEANPGLIDDDEWVDFLAPTRLYHDVVDGLRKRSVNVKAFAHITGGGLPENLERLLNEKGADITIPRWDLGAVGKVLSFVEDSEAVKTFNMGFGWVAVVPADMADEAVSFHEGAMVIGTVDDSGKVQVKVSS